jgi:hypothetical protein
MNSTAFMRDAFAVPAGFGVKRAGDEADMESALSSLVHGKLEDTAPGLMQYLVGLQTLDTDADKGRAIALAGFKIRKNWLYVPAFYINGQIKGMDMMYSRAANLFVPLKDNWVGYIMSKEPGSLGKLENKSDADLHLLAPDFVTAYTGAGIGRVKGAAERAGAAGYLRKVAAVDAEVAGKLLLASKAASFDLRYWCSRIPHFSAVLAKTASDNHEFRAALATYYDLGELFGDTVKVAAAVERARSLRLAAMPKRAAVTDFSAFVKRADYDVEAERGGVVKVARDNIAVYAADLTDYQKSRIYAGASVYLDTRKRANLAMRSKVARALDSSEAAPGVDVRELKPAQTVSLALSGNYDVLQANGDTKTMFVSPRIHPLAFTRSSSVGNTLTGSSLVYDYESGQAKMVRTDRLVCLPPSSGLGDGNDLREKSVELSSMKPGFLYSLVFPDGSMSNIFQACGRKTGDDADTYQVRYVDRIHTPQGSDDYIPSSNEYVSVPGESTREVYSPRNRDMQHTTGLDYDERVLTFKGNSYRISNVVDSWTNQGNLCVIVQRKNDNTKLMVRALTAVVGSKVKAVEVGVPFGYSAADGDKFPGLGSSEIMWNTAFSLADSTAMHIKKANDGVVVDFGGRRYAGGKEAALDHLVIDVGLREKQAREVLAAFDRDGDLDLVVVKSAAPHPGGGEDKDIGAPWPVSFPSSFSDYIGRSAQEPQELKIDVPGAASQARMDYPYSIFEDSEVKNVLNAAKAGDKDVFDVSAVKGLVKTVDISGIIDEYLPDLIRAVDRLGRLRFIAFWHIDKLEERFGQQELVDLENHLKNDFESLGDTVLFLQRKVTDADPARMALDDGKLDTSI